MMPEEKMQENLNVFLHSSFFVPLKEDDRAEG